MSVHSDLDKNKIFFIILWLTAFSKKMFKRLDMTGLRIFNISDELKPDTEFIA